MKNTMCESMIAPFIETRTEARHDARCARQIASSADQKKLLEKLYGTFRSFPV
jgi:hypothetical protein